MHLPPRQKDFYTPKTNDIMGVGEMTNTPENENDMLIILNEKYEDAIFEYLVLKAILMSIFDEESE